MVGMIYVPPMSRKGQAKGGCFQTQVGWGSKATDVGEDSKWDGLQRTGPFAIRGVLAGHGYRGWNETKPVAWMKWWDFHQTCWQIFQDSLNLELNAAVEEANQVLLLLTLWNFRFYSWNDWRLQHFSESGWKSDHLSTESHQIPLMTKLKAPHTKRQPKPRCVGQIGSPTWRGACEGRSSLWRMEEWF